MNSRTLGIDLGTNSIGWSLVEFNDNQQPIGLKDCGVRIFQEAVDVKTRIPKNQERRAARSARKLQSRRKMRRKTLLNLLINYSLLPKENKEREALLLDDKLYNPYVLRARGLDEKLTLFQFGRAIYHLNQRRGFMSNRKTGKKKDEGPVKQDILEINEEIEKTGCRSLGEFLASKKSQRKRYTSREMYKDEFEQLWEAQRKYYPETYLPELKVKIFKTIFFQRPLKLQKNLIGKCTFEPSRKRAAKAWLPAQKFRILQDLNNLKIKDPTGREMRSLEGDERKILFTILQKQKTLTWKKARRLLGLHDGEIFNLEQGQKKELIGNRTACDMRNILKSRWDKMNNSQQDSLVTDILTIDNENGFLRRMKEHWGFGEKEAEKLATTELEKGFILLSLKAIRNILPYMEEWQTYDKACLSAGYDHSAPGKGGAATKRLGEPKDIRNPVVQKALWETRKVVNALINKFGKPDTIRIEMARDMKMSKKQREEIQKRQKKQENENEKVRNILREELGFQQPSRADVQKYQMWEECNMRCPYTGKTISRQMLFSPEVDVEHILPYSRSLDDSYMNKTLCNARENREVKRNQTPYEAYHANEKKYQEILSRIKNVGMPWPKRRKFEQQEINTDEFIERQLNDTRYICVEVKNYLKQLGIKVEVSKGAATYDLRKKWNLNTILALPGESGKNREDHRHHAIDATVVALTSISLFQKLSKISAATPYGIGLSGNKLKVSEPWDNFASDVRGKILGFIISHAPSRKISGALHEDTAYGMSSRKHHQKGKIYLVRRVPLEKITNNQINQIRDDELKKIVLDRVDEYSGDLKKAFVETLYHKDGKTPVHSVRIETVAKESSVHGIIEDRKKPYKYYQYGSNHHVEILENVKTGKRKGIFVTTMEAARRARIDKIPIVQKNHGEEWKFVMSLSTNDMVEVVGNDEIKIYRVQKMDGSNKRINLRLHNAATLEYNGQELIKSPMALRCKKISVDPICNVSFCND